MGRQLSNFVDETQIVCRSGPGGAGCVSFRREKYEPRGGPDGGDGGRGGHVILVGDPHLSTLLDFGRNTVYEAERGQHGSGKNQTGRNGADVVLKLPLGTLVRDLETGEVIVDLSELDQPFVVCRGGAGGRGNKQFATSTHQAPRESEPGGEAEERKLKLELKLMAEVGLLGLPNAGKSTFLSRISAAQPKIASYPFTTLTPQLGIAELDLDRRLVVADIPGLVEGASEGVGLGTAFLKHLERTQVLLHLVDPYELDREGLLESFRVIRAEIRNYQIDLGARPIVTALTKADLFLPEERHQILEAFREDTGEPATWISAATGVGASDLLDTLYRIVDSLRSESNPRD